MEYLQADARMGIVPDQYYGVLASIKTPVLIIDKGISVEFCNAAFAELFNRSISEISGYELLSVFPGIERTQLYHAIQKCLRIKKQSEVETRLGQNYLQVQVYPLSDRLLILFQDLTERKQAESEMRRSMSSLARSNAIIAALSQVAARIETASDTDQAVDALGAELAQLGVDCAVTLSDPASDDLIVRYISIKLGISDQVKRLFGISLNGLRLHTERTDLLNGDQIDTLRFFSDLIPYLIEMFPTFDRENLEKIVRWIGIQPFTPVICLPIKGKETLLGHLSLWGLDLRQEDIPTLSIFANQIGGLIEKARLIEALERRSRETETLRQATAAVSSALDLDQVLERILIQLDRVIPYHSAAIFLLEGARKRIVAARGFSNSEQVTGLSFDENDPLLDEAGQSLSPILLADAQSDPRFGRWANTDNVRGWMGVPLVARGELIGFLTVDSEQVGAFDESHAKLCQAFANEVAMAIDNARLFRETLRLSITDPLTGLYNRRYIYREAQRELERAQRYDRPLSVIIFDLDRFKEVNDHFGHLTGDDVLKVMAQRCLDSLRQTELMGRYGGEEFIVFVPETGLDGAYQVAERLRKAIADQPIETRGHLIRVTASFGVAEFNELQGDLDKLLDLADQALYVAKRAGGNRVSTDCEIEHNRQFE